MAKQNFEAGSLKITGFNPLQSRQKRLSDTLIARFMPSTSSSEFKLNFSWRLDVEGFINYVRRLRGNS